MLKPCKLHLAVKKSIESKISARESQITINFETQSTSQESAIVFVMSHTIEQCSNVVTKIASLNGFI